MDEIQFRQLTDWVIGAGLAGEAELAIVNGFCERAVAAGLPLARAHILIDALHPVHEGHLFRWGHDPDVAPTVEYGRTTELEALARSGADTGVDQLIEQRAANVGQWQRSPFYWMLQTGDSLLRRRLTADTETEFSVFPELRAIGMTAATSRLSIALRRKL